MHYTCTYVLLKDVTLKLALASTLDLIEARMLQSEVTQGGAQCHPLAYFEVNRALACVLLALNESAWCVAEGAVETLLG